MGAFDAVFTAEAQDDDAIMAFAASMGALGNHSNADDAGLLRSRNESDP
jgi:uncharacterized protein with GYD domain